MESTILNFYDLVLLISAFIALLLVSMLSSEPQTRTRYILQLFLVLLMAESAYTIAFYSVLGKTVIADNFPVVYFLLVATFFAKGQVLFLYTKDYFTKERYAKENCTKENGTKEHYVKAHYDKGQSTKQSTSAAEYSLHLLPLAVYSISILLTYQSGSSVYETFVSWQSRFSFPAMYHFIQIGYASAALYLVYRRYALPPTNTKLTSNSQRNHYKSLLIIIISCLCLWCINFASHLAYYLTRDIDIASMIGKIVIAGNFMLVISLFRLFWQHRHIPANSIAHSDKEDENNALNTHLTSDIGISTKYDLGKHIQNIEHKLIELKPFLKPHITLENMADELDISAAALSLLLKEFYHTNFYQFINQQRIEEAKQLLLSEDANTHISQIYTLAGFSSRTTFNVKFKQFVGITPSEYRRQHCSTKQL